MMHEDGTPGAVVAVMSGIAGAKCLSCAPSAARVCVHELSVRQALALPCKGTRHTQAHMASYQNIVHQCISADGNGLRVIGKSRKRIDLPSQHSAVVCSQVQHDMLSDDDSTCSWRSTDVEWFWETCGEDVTAVSVFYPEEELQYDAIRECMPALWHILESPKWIPAAVEEVLWRGQLTQVRQQYACDRTQGAMQTCPCAVCAVCMRPHNDGIHTEQH